LHQWKNLIYKGESYMITQVWSAKYVPNLVPEFVDTHVTVREDDEGYLFEIYLSHPVFSDTKNIEKKAKRLLTKYGFRGLELIYHGEKPKHLVEMSQEK